MGGDCLAANATNQAGNWRKPMERIAIRLGGIELSSPVMNASGPHSAEKGEILELGARHRGAILFKSCNIAGLEAPDNLKNRGVEHFAALARELTDRGKTVFGSVVGNTDSELVDVAKILDRSGVKVLELNLADDYVQNSVGAFASLDRLRDVIKRVRGEVQAVLAVKIPPRLSLEAEAIADLLKQGGVAIVVCANDLAKDFTVDLRTGRTPGAPRSVSQVHRFFQAGGSQLDVVAVGGINRGRDAYIAHLTGARAVQVGSALIKEGAGALGRIDRELNDLLAESGKSSVNEIVGDVHFQG
jgi:dihydroorotate dehydrogenase